MPVVKQKPASANAVMKAAEPNDSLDTFIRQAIGKEPSLSFSKTGDNPIQWIQLLHALDQQGTDLPGWPLLSPVKIQLQKCEKCSREFCSTINYRRHIRLHRRSLNHDRDSNINTREALGTFWDKLSSEEAMEIVSIKDVTLEELAGSSIIKALTSFIRKPGFSSLPPAYMKAGHALLDIVLARPSRFPVTARELFNILDDASEKTFLCAGKAESLQKYVFDGEAGKIGLEIRNLVACTSFLIEQKLVKAWLADKDAESLRFQKLLVEEEEAAQKRQAELLERKRLKKLRQKEQQKAKAQPNEAVADSPDTSDGGVLSPSASIPLDPSSTPSETPDFLQGSILLLHEPTQGLIGDDCEANEPLSGPDTGCSGSNAQVEHKTYRRNGRVHPNNSRWHVQKLQRGSSGFHTKPGSMQKHTFYRDSRATSFNNVNKVWTPKPKSENDEESCRTRSNTEETRASDQHKILEVLIGSISVAIGNCNKQSSEEHPGNRNADDTEPPVPKCSIQDKPSKADDRSVVKHWRPVSRDLVKNTPDGSEVEAFGYKGNDESLRACPDDYDHESHPIPAGKVADRLAAMKFSSSAAEEFLAQRWKEAVAADHVEPVVPESELPGCSDLSCNGGSGDAVEAKSKYRSQVQSGSKVKYIPKQRNP